MGAFSLPHWLIVLAVVLVVFGPGRIAGVMGDLGQGLRSFRKGMAEEDQPDQPADRDQPSDKP
ncbi:twin-arginine translocase TatA/TatE family subunit [Pelagibacterium lacus]|uniref:Sec-independent protein translocase protein TatA n=1 Tax=Pelagibacterium lacus TaxID=2282655 RepID=A0A369W643_9HYPH|nr:twin-arginine translocase TatA/TatE family subunit [Pelagibacterium lacus]RDE09489.1 twin-arginine translocase TatA/TatE family subunit [Pelagibacterium lacus]